MIYLLKHMGDQRHLVKKLKKFVKEIGHKKMSVAEVFSFKQDAQKFAELCLQKASSNISDRLFSKIMMFWGISEHYCDLGYQKLAEFRAYKRTNSRTAKNCVTKCLKAMVAHYQHKWFCIGYNNIWYYKKASGNPYAVRDNIPLDKTATLEIIDINSKYVSFSFAVARRRVVLKVKDTCKGLFVLQRLLKAFILNHYTKVHNFGSFAPRRRFNLCDLLTRGESYFRVVYDLIKAAKYEVMITGWFVSPEFPLIRPLNTKLDVDQSSLYYILGEAARERGVVVYILIYKEFSGSLYNDSEHTKETLEKIHPNIKVIAHPKSILFFWSHHEKMVIVDRKVVLIGGLDIAWGRWDDKSMRLFDQDINQTYFPGMDYYNPFIKDFVKGRHYQTSLLDSAERPPRMPWHDYGVRMEGPIVFDYLTHFVTYWNNARESNNEHQVLLTQFIQNTVHNSNASGHPLRNRGTFMSDYQIMKAGQYDEDFSPVDRLKSHNVARLRRETDERLRFSRLLKEIDNRIINTKNDDTEEGHGGIRTCQTNRLVRSVNPNLREIRQFALGTISFLEPVNVNFRLKTKVCPNQESHVYFLDKKVSEDDRKKLEGDMNIASLMNSLHVSEIPSNYPNWEITAHAYDYQFGEEQIKNKVS